MEKQVMRKMFAITLGGMMMFVASSAVQADTILFQDNFNNGTVATASGATGTLTNFWTIAKPADSANGDITESGGILTERAGGPSSTTGIIGLSLRSGTPSGTFNFFTQPLKFSATVGVTGDTANLYSRVVRLALTSVNTTNYSSNDALAVRIRNKTATQDEISLSYKLNNGNTTPDGTNASVTFLVGSGGNGVTVTGFVTGFDLTLDANSYTLVAYHTGGTGNTTWTGTHVIPLAQWGDGISGNSALELETVRGESAVNKTVTSTWDVVTVSQIPEPATLGLLVLGGLMMTFRGGRCK